MPGQWHNSMEELFPTNMREVNFICKSQFEKTARRTDVNLKDGLILEIQNSYISEQEINERCKNWKIFGKEIIWFVNGNTSDVECEMLTNGKYLIKFNEAWKYKSFIQNYDNILLDINGQIFKIELKKIKCKMIVLSKPKCINDVCDILKNNPKEIWDVWDETNVENPKLTVYQQGAGNGKTYNIWKNICENKDKKIYIIVTKQHSAKNVIYEELIDQEVRKEYHIENLTEKQEENTPKHYVIKYKHKISQKECVVSIGTIDSFFYSLSTSDKSSNFFEGILNNIYNNVINKLTQYGHMWFANQPLYINKQCEIWIDEVQDLPISYLFAITSLMHKTCCDVNIVGDKLQTLEFTRNFLTEIQDNGLPNIDILYEKPKNDNRRIKVKDMSKEINNIVNFRKYDLKEINCSDESKLLNTNENPFELIDSPNIYTNDTDEIKVSDFIEKLIGKMDEQVEKYNYTPECFMFLFPIMKCNILANELGEKIQSYWINKFKDKEYKNKIKNEYWKNYDHTKYTQYVYIHKHTEGLVINTKDSIYSTRIMSIRSSKGDGREVVFILNTTESSLKIVSNQEKGLIYESHLHVALTRAKNKIFFGLQKNNDDIHYRINSSSHNGTIEYLPKISTNLFIDNIYDTLNLEKIKNLLSDYIDKDEELNSLNDQKCIKEQVDWEYHCIKHSIFLYRVIFNIINPKHLKSQLFTVIKKIKNIKPVRKTVHQYWKYLKEKQYNIDKEMKEMPICIFNKEYKWKEYSNRIENTIKDIQKKSISKLNNSNIYENIVLIHMMDVFSNQQFSNIIPSKTLYDITHYFNIQSNTKEKELLKEPENIDNIVKAHFENKNKNDWNWNIFKHIELHSEGNNDIHIKKLQFPIIGYTDDKVCHIMLINEINELNFWNIMIKCLIERFLIYNPNNPDDIKKYYGKEIETIIFLVKEGTTKIIDWDWDKKMYNQILDEIKESIIKHFESYHKNIYDYFIQIKNSNCWGNSKKHITPFMFMIDKLNQNWYPSYIIDLFKHFESKFRKEGNIKQLYDTFDNFNKSLLDKLHESLDFYFPTKTNDIDLSMI